MQKFTYKFNKQVTTVQSNIKHNIILNRYVTVANMDKQKNIILCHKSITNFSTRFLQYSIYVTVFYL